MQESSIATSCCCSRINLDVEINAARSIDSESEIETTSRGTEFESERPSPNSCPWLPPLAFHSSHPFMWSVDYTAMLSD